MEGSREAVMFKLVFTTDNDAFAEAGHLEAARIIEQVAQRVREEDYEGYVSEINGNVIGHYKLVIED
jgi:hypothetical protein